MITALRDEREAFASDQNQDLEDQANQVVISIKSSVEMKINSRPRRKLDNPPPTH